MFGELFPILSSRDAERLTEFYRTVFDATETYRFPAEGTMAYVGLRVGRSSLGIGAAADAPDGSAGRERITLWVYADDCDIVVERARAAGAQIVAEPADQEWGERVAVLRDPDGNEVYVGTSK